MATGFYVGRRLSVEGHLCTVRYHGLLAETTGQWLGVEWDDPSRGKHDGKHRGAQIFKCVCDSATAASFIRPSRKFDQERTVIQAIKHKYGGDQVHGDPTTDVVVISGKIAEEVGFDKIATEQAQLAELRIVLLDQLVVNGLAPRGSSPDVLLTASNELTTTCPNITQLDLGWNVLEKWSQIVDICAALPKLKILRLGGLRLQPPFTLPGPLSKIQELHLDECLLSAHNIYDLIARAEFLPALEELYLSGNHLCALTAHSASSLPSIQALKSLVLENNDFTDLTCLSDITKLFATASLVSLQGNHISRTGFGDNTSSLVFPQITTLNLSDNLISSYAFIDELAQLLPNLSSLRITNNPLFKPTGNSTNDDSRASEKSYYLTLARISSLETLNYAKITSRDREEGEIYYLSVAEAELKDLLSTNETVKTQHELAHWMRRLYPRYQILAQKYGRHPIFAHFSSLDDDDAPRMPNVLMKDEKKYPAGSLGARLVKAIFYIPHDACSSGDGTEVPLTIPSSLAATQVMGLLLQQRAFQGQIRPLQFNLIYESTELDPVDTTAESTTRSAIYGRNLTADAKRSLWQEWGDWDADALVEAVSTPQQYTLNVGSIQHDTVHAMDEHWTEDGKILIREGRKWKRRETQIQPTLKRPWGDFLDGAKEVRIRVESIKVS